MPVKRLAKIAVGAWFLLTGLIQLFDFSFNGLGTVMAVLALGAGVLMIIDK